MATARVFLVFVMVTALAGPAWAYVDPNSGGLIFQIAMPILSVGIAALTLLRKRIAASLTRLKVALNLSPKAKPDSKVSDRRI